MLTRMQPACTVCCTCTVCVRLVVRSHPHVLCYMYVLRVYLPEIHVRTTHVHMYNQVTATPPHRLLRCYLPLPAGRPSGSTSPSSRTTLSTCDANSPTCARRLRSRCGAGSGCAGAPAHRMLHNSTNYTLSIAHRADQCIRTSERIEPQMVLR